MLCPNCGTDNPEGSSFCEQCGAPLGAPAAPAAGASAYPGWTVETERGKEEGFDPPRLAALLEQLAEGTGEFLILTPPAQIEGSRYLQTCSDDGGALHMELCMARGTAGFEMYGADGVTASEAAEMFAVCLAGRLPRLPRGKAWALIWRVVEGRGVHQSESQSVSPLSQSS